MALGDPQIDSTQQPITAADPRIAKLLALVQAQRQAQPIAPVDPSQQIAPVAAPAPPPNVPGLSPPAPPPPSTAPGAPNLNPAAPPVAATPAPPSVPQTKPGPVKSFLMSLGSHLAAGLPATSDALLHHAGLPTAYEKQQNALKIGLQQQQQDSLEGLRAAQANLASGKGAQLDQLTSPYTIDAADESVMPQFRGAKTTFGGYQALQALAGKTAGAANVATIGANAKTGAAQIGANAREDLGHQLMQFHHDLADRQYNLQQARLGILRSGLGLRGQMVNGALYGTDMNGNPLPGAAQIGDDEGNLTTVGSRFAPTAVKQQKTVATFNDLTGSVKNLRSAIQQYQSEGGNLNDPTLAAAAADPTSTIGRVINGQLVTGGLSPTQIKLLNAQRQTREQAGILRTTTGGTASEAGAQRILDTVPTFGQDTNESALSKLDEQEKVLGRLSAGQTRVHGGVAVKNPTASPAEGTTKVNSSGDKIVFKGGKWGPA